MDGWIEGLEADRSPGALVAGWGEAEGNEREAERVRGRQNQAGEEVGGDSRMKGYRRAGDGGG